MHRLRSLKRLPAFALFLFLAIALPALAQPVKVSTWNLEWFPNGSPKDIPVAEQNVRIAIAAETMRKIDPDILLVQEVKDYDACSRLAEAIRPNTYQVAICSAFSGKQQAAILAKLPAQAAWSETWKSIEGIDPPRGFAFAWFKVGTTDVGIYSLHLKSNLITHGSDMANNIRKREVAIGQLLTHVRDMLGRAIPSISSVIVGGDFNTNSDQEIFATEKTLLLLSSSGYRNVFQGIPFIERITHPGGRRYPPATFDYLFGKNAYLRKPIVTPSTASDHFPVTSTVDFP